MSYDEECYNLAKYFLADEPGATEDQAKALAEAIQSTIEDWLEFDREAPKASRDNNAAAAQ